MTSTTDSATTEAHQCALCKKEFVPEEDQLPAWWAVNWASFSKGLLCPPCNAAAKELGSEFSEETPYATGLLPYGSDITKKSGRLTKTQWLKHRASESWSTFVFAHHPEWLTEEEKTIIGGRL